MEEIMNRILNFNELDILAEKLADYAHENIVIALIGDLGTGKTTFTQKFAKSLGVTDVIKSPTFNYVLEYFTGRLPLYHFDVYRLSEPEEIYEIGYEDYLNNDGVVLIEWANIIESELPKEYIKLELKHYDDRSREVELTYIGNEAKEKEMLDYVGFSN
jgi:tRNA threonylcarbamoyladenosine biosynthesis protein TsaE